MVVVVGVQISFRSSAVKSNAFILLVSSNFLILTFFFFFMLLVQKNDYPAHRITFTDIWTGLSAQHFEDGLQIQFLARIIKGTACAINSRSYKYHYIRPYRL